MNREKLNRQRCGFFTSFSALHGAIHDSPKTHKAWQTKGLSIFAVEGKKRLASGAGAEANQIF